MNNWKFKNFEKSNSESHINIFKSLEIENYLKQLLKKTNKKIHTYKLNFSNSTITIFLSIYKENSHRHKNNFLKNMIKSLTKFTNNKFHIILKLKVIKKNLFDKIKNKFLLNMNFRRLKIPGKLYLILATQTNLAELLGSYITEQIKITKQHNFFFNSLKKSLTLLIKQKFSKIKGIKILIKGRLNNAPRSRTRIIKIGKIPIITENVVMDYSESTSFKNSNGTIGVKIWINYVRMTLNLNNSNS